MTSQYLGGGQFISSDTLLPEDCLLGHGSCIGYGSLDLLPPKIGREVVVGAFCLVYRQSTISDGVNIDNYCRIGNHVIVGESSKILYGAQLYDRCVIGKHCIIGSDVSERVVIEDYVTFMGLMAHSHRNPNLDWDTTDEPSPIIREGSVVGVGAIIVGDATIGPFSYVGAGEIVRHDIPPHTVYLKGQMSSIDSWRGFIRVRDQRA